MMKGVTLTKTAVNIMRCGAGLTGFVSSGLHPDPALSLEEEAPGLAGVLQLSLPSGLQHLVLSEWQPADAVLHQSQPTL